MKNDVMGKGRVAGRRCRSRLYALARSPLPVLTTGMWVGDSNEPLEIIVIPKNSTLVEVESIIARIADARGGSKTRHLLVLGVEHLPAILRASKASQDERFRSDSHFVCQQMAEEQHGDLIIKYNAMDFDMCATIKDRGWMGEEALEVMMNEAESNRWKPLPEAWVEVMARASAQCERVMKILGDLGRSWEIGWRGPFTRR